MHERTILAWLLIGVIVGVLARLVVRGRDPGGGVVSVVVGIAGALLAGFTARAAGLEPHGRFATHGAAFVGSVILLLLYRTVVDRRR